MAYGVWTASEIAAMTRSLSFAERISTSSCESGHLVAR